ncbi:3-hydroxybenzoate 6-monooxygenase [Micromonospora sp. NPDC051196]|uniref:3-hydroxybenzoate 6-monooxygenase n=1 Tax=Micromonospora sp. NPDC051196 TaxID=3155281 RepID=UPI00344A416C
MSAHVLIVGGGIGGLAAALAVVRHGHRVTVLERHPQFTELGAGIQLAPNAFEALDQLGVGDEVRRRAVFIDELRLMDGTTGKPVAAMPLTDRYRQRFGNPYVVVHRNDLYRPLLAACGGVAGVQLRAGAAVTGYGQDEAGVTARLETGEELRGDVLIGADGIRSVVRRQLIGDGEPLVSGHTIYRSLIPMRLVPDELRWNTVTLWAGPRWHFVHYPVSEGELLNLAAVRDDGATEAVVGRPTERRHVLGEFAQMSDVARQLLELGAEWRSWVLCDRDPAPGWTDGRVTLLGDAAHPMLQYAAQGACMALEDAVRLGTVFAGACDDLPGRLACYQAARLGRTARAQLTSRAMTGLYHPAGPDAWRRNEMLAGLTADQMYEKVAWLHGGPDGG